MTIGMLSGLLRTSFTCSLREARTPATTKTSAIGSAILGLVHTSASWIDARRRTIEIPNRISGRVRKLMKSTTRGSAPVLQGSADAAVLADAPEVHGHQDRRDDGDRDAVEDVEAQQRLPADEPPAEERVADVVARVDERDPVHVEEVAERALVPDARVRAGHVRADGHGPDRELVPRQEVAGEGEEQRQHEQHDADAPVELPRRLV